MQAVKNIKITRDEIRATEQFKKLSPVLQKITLQRSNVMSIENGVNVSNNIGYEKWDKQTATRYTNRIIVKELHQELIIAKKG